MSVPTQLEPDSTPARLGPADRRDAVRWLGVAAAGFVLGQVLALIVATIAAAIAGTPGGVTALAKEAVPPAWFVAIELASLWVGMGGAAWVVTRSGRSVGLSVRASDGWYVLVGIGLQLGVSALYSIFHPGGLGKPVKHLLGGGPGWELLIPGVMTVLLAPVFEELFFRGVLLRSFLVLLETRVALVGIAVSVALDATLFGLAHLGNDTWIQLPGLIGVGIVLCVLAVRTGRLGPSIVTHASFNALAVLAFAVQR